MGRDSAEKFCNGRIELPRTRNIEQEKLSCKASSFPPNFFSNLSPSSSHLYLNCFFFKKNLEVETNSLKHHSSSWFSAIFHHIMPKKAVFFIKDILNTRENLKEVFLNTQETLQTFKILKTLFIYVFLNKHEHIKLKFATKMMKNSSLVFFISK